MQSSKIRNWVVSLLVIGLSLGFITFQLQKFAVDSSLNNWADGVPGYIQSVRDQKTTGKPMAVFFYTDWCQNCRQLRENILSAPETQEYMRSLIPVKVNPEHNPINNQLAEDFGVYGYPMVFLIPADNGKPIHVKRTSNISAADFVKQCQDLLAS